MIVRDVVSNPDMIEKSFDFFNDAQDTLGWLSPYRSQPSELGCIEARLRAAYEAWLKEFR